PTELSAVGLPAPGVLAHVLGHEGRLLGDVGERSGGHLGGPPTAGQPGVFLDLPLHPPRELLADSVEVHGLAGTGHGASRGTRRAAAGPTCCGPCAAGARATGWPALRPTGPGRAARR